MGNITVVQRKVNTGTIHPISVRYNHPAEVKGETLDYVVAVGQKCDERHFNKQKGRVEGVANAPEINAAIQSYVSRMERSVRNVTEAGKNPTASRVKAMFLSLPSVQAKVEKLIGSWKQEGLAKIQILQHELDDLEAAVEAKKLEIAAMNKEIGIGKEELLVNLIDEFITEKKQLSKNKKLAKRSKNSFADATEDSYLQLKKEINAWNTKLNIYSVTKKTLDDFESSLIELKYLNGTTFVYMQKFVAVLNHYKESYELTSDYKDYTCELPLKEENVIYLTKEELKAFREVEITHRNISSVRKQQEVRDLALLMAMTGLRFVDAHIKRTDIVNNTIVKAQQKTGSKVFIPFTDTMRDICEKYNYELRGKSVRNWNENFRKLLAKCNVPSLFEKITVMNYIGTLDVPDVRPKYMHCSAHTMRRTMINQCMLRNMRTDKITKMTGHKKFDVFQTYVDRNTNAYEMDEVFDYLLDEV
jgi:hypothetical protein